jgi:rubrerythrin
MTCDNKRQYTTAKRALRHASKIHPATYHGLKAYKCDQCGYWHLGHKGTPFARLLRQVAEFRRAMQKAAQAL